MFGQKTPLDERPAKPGDQKGRGWTIRPTASKDPLRYVLIDVNTWKTFMHERWNTEIGDGGSLAWFNPQRGRDHQMYAEHVTSEKPVTVEATGRKAVEWKPPPPGRENHLGDCTVGCMVAASIAGCELPELRPRRRKAKKRRKKVSKLKT